MKYVKPSCDITRFELNTAIAANCNRIPIGTSIKIDPQYIKCLNNTTDKVFNSLDHGCEMIYGGAVYMEETKFKSKDEAIKAIGYLSGATTDSDYETGNGYTLAAGYYAYWVKDNNDHAGLCVTETVDLFTHST